MFEKSYFIIIGGEQIAVTEEIYYAYKRPLWAERKRRERNSRCRDSKGIRCAKDCRHCDKERDGRDLSLEKFAGDGYELADATDIAEIAVENLLIVALRRAVAKLSDDERQIIVAAFQGKSERDAAAGLGIPRKTFVYRRDKIVDKLRKLRAN